MHPVLHCGKICLRNFKKTNHEHFILFFISNFYFAQELRKLKELKNANGILTDIHSNY